MKNTSQHDRAWRRWVRLATTLGLLVLGGCSREPGRGGGELVLSGNLEVVDPQLGFKIAGRVVARPVAEGDAVTAGQLIAQLDDSEQKEQLAVRRAELGVATAALDELEAGSRPEEIAAVEATWRSVEAERERAGLDFQRSQELRGGDVIAQRDFEAAQAQYRVAEARAVEANERLKLARLGPREETIRQGRARVEQARAAVALAETQLDNTRLVSPLTGVVLSHNIEVGEFVSPGTPVVTVADTVHLWVRAYVNQTDLGRIKLGGKAAVRTDTFPDKTYEGRIGFIATEAEFTPKTVQTTKERTRLVFRVKVYVDNSDGELKAGMPADVIVSHGS